MYRVNLDTSAQAEQSARAQKGDSVLPIFRFSSDDGNILLVRRSYFTKPQSLLPHSALDFKMLHRGKSAMVVPPETISSEGKVIVEFASGLNSDDEQLEAMGHVQELRRNFSIWSIVALQISLMATWEALSTVVSAALTSGGAPYLFCN
ncbi:hypothetical protein N7474_006911 [Penicillium riverlandense]|uniref:uncharacterized protein n=1 Tax=Penicillium riverlandense TaxID=1903569 RepID=UPI002548BE86|nr:uncharacterized protein N7474_006911 [Penicillium riverlandense]KAJ5815134.1 hypothetical protein N7474_006911 [Penicillium riverlandense]